MVNTPASIVLLVSVCVAVVPTTPVRVLSAKVMVLLVNVCVAVVPTKAPEGAVRDVVHAEPVETAIPAPGYTCEKVGAAALVQVEPLDVKTLPFEPGATKAGVDVPLPKMTLLAVRVASPVPPLATGVMLAASSLTVPAAFLKYSFSSVVLMASSPSARLPVVGTADAVDVRLSWIWVKPVAAF